MPAFLNSLNFLVSFASAMFGVVALVRPASLTGSKPVESGETFYARLYAAHAVPFGLITGFLPFLYPGPAVAWMLFTAALVQMGDFAIGVAKQERGMMIGPPLAAAVHILCGLAFL